MTLTNHKTNTKAHFQLVAAKDWNWGAVLGTNARFAQTSFQGPCRAVFLRL